MLNTLLLADHECQDSNVVIRNKQKIGKNPLHNIMQCKQLSATFIAYNRTCHLAIEVITDKLIAAGYNIDAQDEYGNTPAHYALMLHERPTLYMVPLLRKYNADLGIANRRGQNPWQCAHSYYEWLVVENESKQIPYRIARTLMPSDHEDIADFSVQDDDDDESMD
jgi:hypothetical protein